MESSEQNVFSSVKLCASPMTETDVTSFALALRYETSAGVVLTVEFKFLKLKVHLVCLT